MATDFVKEIEKGNWSANYALANGENGTNALEASLLSLRTQLQTYALEEKERNWVTEGLGKFMDILRSKNDNITELTDNIISHLVKYLGANQGGLYLLNDDNAQDPFIEMTACYAYDRKKHLNQRIEIGEGLAGQAVLEKDVIYMTDIPKSYVRITSGLGDAPPSNLLIVPLKIEETVFGVVEIASFSKIQKYQIEFVQRLGESIASTLSTVKTNQRTHKLLQETQTQAEQMRSQEEEMRQNMEELSATQEEIQRVLKDVQDKEKFMTDMLNVSKDNIYVIDKEYKISHFNLSMAVSLESIGIKVHKGFDILSIYPDNKEKEKQRAFYDRAFRGENHENTDEYTTNGVSAYFTVNFAPLRDINGEVIAVANFSKDTTAIMTAQKQTEKLLLDTKKQTEEMQRVLKEVQSKERYLNELINVPKDSIFTVGKDYKIISYNKAMAAGLEALGLKELDGLDMLSFYPDPAEKKKQKDLMDRAFAGENFEVTTEFDMNNGAMSYFSVNYAPLTDENGEVFAIANFAKDTTAIVTAQKQAEQLLYESKQQSEEMRAQEEELRQNMEELSATQEEMQRLLQEVQGKEKYVNELLNVASDTIFTLGKDYKVIHFNQAFTETIKGLGFSDPEGFDLMSGYTSEEEKEKSKVLYERAFAGESFEVTTDFTFGDQTIYFNTNYAPLRNDMGEIIAVANFVKNVTETVLSQKEMERLLKESKSQTEEMRAQEEELRQNMEELSTTQEEMHRVLKEVQEKERYLNELINVPKDSIFTVGRDYKILSFNKAMAVGLEALGIKEVAGFDLLSLYPDAAEKKKQKAIMDRAFAGENFEITTEYDMNGVMSYFSVNYAPLSDEKGKVFAIASFAKDTTGIVTAQKQAEENERYLNELINVPNDSIFTLDKDFKLISFNNALAKGLEMSGVTLKKGDDILAGLNEEERARELANYKRAFQGENFEVVNVITVMDQKMFFAINYAPIRNGKGEIASIVVFSKDVTALQIRSQAA
jgi:PAS domain S-box-containing protein